MRPLVAWAFCACCFAAYAAGEQAVSESKRIVCFQPATRWEDGMVTGNGLVGTLHYAALTEEVVVFNCHKFLYPNGAPFPIPEMRDRLEPMRDLMLAGKTGEGWRLYNRELQRRRGLEPSDKSYYGMSYTQTFHAGYQLQIASEPSGQWRDYRRGTNYQTGEVDSQWTDDRGQWRRQSFASRADQLLVTRLLAPAGETIACQLTLGKVPKTPSRVTSEVIAESQQLHFRARYPKTKGRLGGYEGVTRVVLRGGQAVA